MMYRRYVLIPEKSDKWRIWDTRTDSYRGKFLQADANYYAISRDVAAMRVRDAHHA